MEGEAAELAEAAAGHSSPARAERAGGVLDEVDVRRHRVLELLPVERTAEEVHREHGVRSRRDRVVHAAGVEVHGLGVDVDEHGARTRERDHVGGRRERIGRHEHLVSLADPEREHGEMERGRSRRDGDRVLDSARAGELIFKLVDLLPHRQLPAFEHLGGGGGLLLAHVGPGEPDHAALPIPGDRALEAVVQFDPGLEPQPLAGLVHVRDAKLDVFVGHLFEHERAGTAVSRLMRLARS